MYKFSLNQNQIDIFEKWDKTHNRRKCRKAYTGAIGGRLTFSFTSTGIGDIVTVRCALCRKEKNLTEYDKW